jgi:hypothetical protein
MNTLNQDKTEYFLQIGPKRIPLIHKQTILGRNPNVTITIDDTSIAREHAVI